MRPHDILDDAARDRAALHALGCLAADDAQDFERHLALCEACRSEVASYAPVVGELGLLATAQDPPSELKERLFRRLAGESGRTRAAIAAVSPADPRHPETQPAETQVWKSWTPDPAAAQLTIVRGGDEGWEQTAVAGVMVRKLFVDKPNDRITMLVRMAAGASYPAHRHGGVEECYVIEGDLHLGDKQMRAGDYQRCAGESVHVPQSTQHGCLLFIVSSMHDELLGTPL